MLHTVAMIILWCAALGLALWAIGIILQLLFCGGVAVFGISMWAKSRIKSKGAWFFLIFVALIGLAYGTRFTAVDQTGLLYRNRWTGRIYVVHSGNIVPLLKSDNNPVENSKIHIYKLSTGDVVNVPNNEIEEFLKGLKDNGLKASMIE